MAPGWSFGSVSFYGEELETSHEVKRAEIFVLDATASVLHFFGAGSNHLNVTGIVIGDTNKTQLETWSKAGTSQTLTAPWGSLGTHVIHGEPKFSAIKYSGATFESTSYSPNVTPLYRCEIEFLSTS